MEHDRATGLSSRGGASSKQRRLGSLSTALSSVTYGPEWHVPKADLLINRQTTTSKIRFPPPSQRKRPAAAFDADAAAAAKARDHDGATVVSQLTADTHDGFPRFRDYASLDNVSETQQRKSRLLGAAASWSYSLGDEDRTVAEVAANANLSARNAIQTLSSARAGNEIFNYVNMHVFACLWRTCLARSKELDERKRLVQK